MIRISPLSFFLVFTLLFSTIAFSYQKSQSQTAVPQTPRQALIEMIRGGGEAITKHLTVEMQQAIPGARTAKTTASARKSGSSGARAGKLSTETLPEAHTTLTTSANGVGFDVAALGMIPAFAGKNLETFETGPIFCTYTDPVKKEKMEVRMENDDLRGTEDDMQLSFHIFKDGQEQPIPFLDGITIGMKQQEGIWRLNEVSTTVRLKVGDPKFFEEMTKAFQEPAQAPATKTTVAVKAAEEHPTLPVSSMMTMLAFAEGMYAQQNPDVGFTCNLADLVSDKSGGTAFSQYLDPQIASGTYNGYRFSISGCDSRPSEVFHLIAEPVAGGKAYCINATHNLRTSDDGRGATCVSAGKPVNSD